MANQNLVDVFNVKKRVVVTPDVTDYEVFPDKDKLEELRTKIIQNLIDNTIPKNLSLEQYINDEIDETLEKYTQSYIIYHTRNFPKNQIAKKSIFNQILADFF